MRRSQIIFVLAGVFAVVACLAFTLLPQEGYSPRYQQHLLQPSEDELGECIVCDGAGLCSHLPIIQIETGGQKIPGKAIVNALGETVDAETGDNGELEIAVQVSVINQENQWNHPTDQPVLESAAMFRIRGNSSRAFDKSSYKLTLVKDDLITDNKQQLLGMEYHHEWALHGPFLDKTLIRNYMWLNICAMISGDAPDVRFCEVVIDGEYRGLYVLMETPGMSKGRTNLTKYQSGDVVTSYMVRIESSKHEPDREWIDNFSTYTHRMEQNKNFEILYPGNLTMTQTLHDYVTADLSNAERKLYSLAHDDFDSIFDYFDLDSFVNYYILQEFLAINDTFNASSYFYKDVRGKITVGPYWDYNNCLNNFFMDMPVDEFILSQRGWFAEFFKSPLFVENVIARYRELRKGLLSDEYLTEYIAATQAYLGSAVDRNFEVWGYSFDPFQLDDLQRRTSYEMTSVSSTLTLEERAQITLAVNPSSFEEATDWMVDYMVERAKWMDNHIDTLWQYCQDSKLASSMLQ